MDYETYEADSAEEAFTKWADAHELNNPDEPGCVTYYSPTGEGYLQKVMVFQLGETNEHLWPEFMERRLGEITDAKGAAKEAKERAEFERLQKKFGRTYGA